MTKEKRHIIVPIDFSEQSTIALSQTYNLARMSSADITLLHVIDEALFSSVLHLFSSKEDQEELLRLGIQTKLNGMANDAKAKSGLEFNTRIEKGKIYDVVAEVAKEINASFIVMGTSGETTLKKQFICSHAIRVISDAPCPVITIKGKKHRSGCNTILLPLDLSKETKEKVTQCIEIALFLILR
ncbi:MAG: universal stress protein [Bacteroidetes bacterium]|nr:universal stress protein [Bacteroidota bacterium]